MPALNPVEGIWSLLRRGWLSDVAFSNLERLDRVNDHGRVQRLQECPEVWVLRRSTHRLQPCAQPESTGGYRQHLLEHAATLGIDLRIVRRDPTTRVLTVLPRLTKHRSR